MNRLGAVVTMSVANEPWPGNPTPRVAEVYGGMLNAIGLQNPGIDVFIERDLAFLKQFDTKVIVNVCGKSVEEAGGADSISLINTLTGMKIVIRRSSFALANKTGGMSGPAIKPVAVRMVWQCANAVKIPIVGMGGIMTAEDAIEFLMAGATAVSVGAANFINPYATAEIADGIEAFMKEQGIEDINEIIGCVR